jgi:nucleoside-triphosphatase THEP1
MIKTSLLQYPGWIKMGKFYFDPEGFRFGQQVLSNIPEEVEWIMIDEYGPMEISGMGWRTAIDQLLERDGLTLMITIRVDLLKETIENFLGHEIHVFNISQSNFPRITTALKKLMSS